MSSRRSRHRKLTNQQRDKLLAKYCGEINDDDAIDPRIYFQPKQPTKQDRKALQLCRQVADTLHYVINSGTIDGETEPLLESVQVVSVVPAPDARRLLVTVSVEDLPNADAGRISATTVNEVLHALKEQTPRLRAEIARSITRRKAPNLIFDVAAGHSGRIENPTYKGRSQLADDKPPQDESHGERGLGDA